MHGPTIKIIKIIVCVSTYKWYMFYRQDDTVSLAMHKLTAYTKYISQRLKLNVPES